MYRLIALLFALFPMSAALRLRTSVGWQLNAMLVSLIDPETGQLRDIHPWYLAEMDRMLRDAETTIARAIWMHAIALSGRSEPFARRDLCAAGDPSTTAMQLVVRIGRLWRLIDAFTRHAHRALDRIDAPAPPRFAAPANDAPAHAAIATPRALDLSG